MLDSAFRCKAELTGLMMERYNQNHQHLFFVNDRKNGQFWESFMEGMDQTTRYSAGGKCPTSSKENQPDFPILGSFSITSISKISSSQDTSQRKC